MTIFLITLFYVFILQLFFIIFLIFFALIFSLHRLLFLILFFIFIFISLVFFFFIFLIFFRFFIALLSTGVDLSITLGGWTTKASRGKEVAITDEIMGVYQLLGHVPGMPSQRLRV